MLHLKLPEALGGVELDPIAYLDVIESLSRIESAAGWCALINCTSIAWPGAFLPDEAIAQIFAGGRVPIAAGAAGPLGPGQAGGRRLPGQRPVALRQRDTPRPVGGGRVPHRGETGRSRRGHLMVAVPVEQVQIHRQLAGDGPQGYGSCDYSMSEVFVSGDFTWDMEKSRPHRGGPHFLMGRPGVRDFRPRCLCPGRGAPGAG